MIYPKDFINKIVLGDSIEVMKEIPDDSVDMILCDLPYGTTACEWDVIIPFESLWKQYKRIIKYNGAIVLFGSEPFSTLLRYSNLHNFKYDWVWNKMQGTGMTICNIQPMKMHELVSVFGYGKIKYNPQKIKRNKPLNTKNWRMSKINSENANYGSKDISKIQKIYTEKYPVSILEFHRSANECNNTKRVHPTQKPLALFKYFVKTYTDNGDLVLDNCIGSGTTAVACKELCRRFIGIELEPKYCKVAEERLKLTRRDNKQLIID